jgi:hypothetical protein
MLLSLPFSCAFPFIAIIHTLTLCLSVYLGIYAYVHCDRARQFSLA